MRTWASAGMSRHDGRLPGPLPLLKGLKPSGRSLARVAVQHRLRLPRVFSRIQGGEGMLESFSRFLPSVMVRTCCVWKIRRANRRIATKLATPLRENGARRIRVAFLVIENQKWSSQSVHDALLNDPAFEPLIFASTHSRNTGKGAGKLRTALEENVAFARRRGMKVVKVYDPEKGAFLPLAPFAPDIVFYEQPYGLPPEHAPNVVSRFALTCYVPYGYGIYLAHGSGQKNTRGFSEYIWRTFLESRAFLQEAGQLGLLKKHGMIAVGYPKMDRLAGFSEESEGGDARRGRRPTVIYAPHHSLSEEHQDRYGTFFWSGEWILEYARRNRDIAWVFRPHPKLRESLVESGLMSRQAVDDYFEAWGSLDNASIMLDGDCIDIFRDSDAMITDSGSFLLEYAYTGHPLLLLKNPASAGYSDFGERIAASLYGAEELGGVAQFLDDVVRARQDPRRAERMKVLPKIETDSGQRIVNHLRSELSGQLSCSGRLQQWLGNRYAG